MVDIIDAGANAFSYARQIRPPVEAGLEYFNYFGRDPLTNQVAPTSRNLVADKAAAIVVGAPVVGDGYVRCHGTVDYIQTAVTAMAENTLICVARAVPPDAGSCPLISNTGSASQTNGAATSGSAIYLNDAVQGNGLMRLTTQQAAIDAGVSATVAASTTDYASSAAGPQMFTGRCKANGDRVAKIMGTGLVATTPSEFPAMLAQPYRIGSQYNTNAVGLVDIYAAIIFSRALSDGELDQIYAFVRTFFARRSIVI